MASKVSIHKDVEYRDIAKVYGKALENWLNTGVLLTDSAMKGSGKITQDYVVRLYINYT